MYKTRNLKNYLTYEAEIWLKTNFWNSNFKEVKRGFIFDQVNVYTLLLNNVITFEGVKPLKCSPIYVHLRSHRYTWSVIRLMFFDFETQKKAWFLYICIPNRIKVKIDYSSIKLYIGSCVHYEGVKTRYLPPWKKYELLI